MRQGGTKDGRWKRKSRNALENLKRGEDVSVTLVYLLEEQHTILETFQGDLASVLLGANADGDTATHVALTSIVYHTG